MSYSPEELKEKFGGEWIELDIEAIDDAVIIQYTICSTVAVNYFPIFNYYQLLEIHDNELLNFKRLDITRDEKEVTNFIKMNTILRNFQ